jgi:hypothetical protein
MPPTDDRFLESNRILASGTLGFLLRSVRHAHDPRKLVLSAAAVALLAGLGVMSEAAPQGYSTGTAGILPHLPSPWPDPWTALQDSGRWVARTYTGTVEALLRPFLPRTGLLDWFRAAGMALAVLAVVALSGGMVARIAAHDFAGLERPRLARVARFAARRLPTLVGTPICPIVGVLFLSLAAALVGLFFRIPAPYGPAIGGVLAVVPLLLAIPAGLLVLGTLLGWPLMVASTAVEAEDLFDALSRSFSYLQQRFLRLAALVGVAWLVGAVGWLVVVSLARLVLMLTTWGLSLGGPPGLIQGLFLETGTDAARDAGPGLSIARFWTGSITFLAMAWGFSWFWVAATAVYLLLRRDVDGTEVDDLARPDVAPPSVATTSDPGPQDAEAPVSDASPTGGAAVAIEPPTAP